MGIVNEGAAARTAGPALQEISVSPGRAVLLRQQGLAVVRAVDGDLAVGVRDPLRQIDAGPVESHTSAPIIG